jgi:hypothetical protein
MSTSNTNGRKTVTTSPVRATPAYVAGADAEFLDAVGVRERFGIKRSLLYELLSEGCIRSASLRRRGCVRGKRLFAVDSIREFLATHMEAK